MLPEIRTIKRINVTDKWAEFWFEEGKLPDATAEQVAAQVEASEMFHWCCKYGNILNLADENLMMDIRNNGWRGIKLVLYYDAPNWEFFCFAR